MATLGRETPKITDFRGPQIQPFEGPAGYKLFAEWEGWSEAEGLWKEITTLFKVIKELW